MNALIVANGEPPQCALLQELAGWADLVIAADGGLLKAQAAGIEPDIVLGDFDSLTAEERRRATGRVIAVPSPYQTDLEKAVHYAIEQGATDIIATAILGGRADHALANFSVLTLFRGQARLRLADDWFEIELVDGSVQFEAEPGTVVSLVAPGGCRGVTTGGLQWPLTDYDLAFSPLGIHNVVESNPVTVQVAEGTLFLFRGRWVEPHAG